MVLALKDIWSLDYKFKIHGRSDSDYATNPNDHRSFSGGRAFVNNIPISFRSATQKFVTLSVMEAEIAAGVIVAHMELLKIRVEFPMILKMNNSGDVDLALKVVLL